MISEIRVCNCGHPASYHLDGTGLGEGCSGDVVIQNPDRPETIAPCSCEAFVLWYVDTFDAVDTREEARPRP